MLKQVVALNETVCLICRLFWLCFRLFAFLPDPDVELMEPRDPDFRIDAAPVPAGRYEFYVTCTIFKPGYRRTELHWTQFLGTRLYGRMSC
jgi:hypothetical protein